MTADFEYTEQLASFTFRDVTERIVIGHNPKTDTWAMWYLRPGQDYDSAQANIIDAESREDIIKKANRFMIGHGRQIIENLIEARHARCP